MDLQGWERSYHLCVSNPLWKFATQSKEEDRNNNNAWIEANDIDKSRHLSVKNNPIGVQIGLLRPRRWYAKTFVDLITVHTQVTYHRYRSERSSIRVPVLWSGREIFQAYPL